MILRSVVYGNPSYTYGLAKPLVAVVLVELCIILLWVLGRSRRVGRYSGTILCYFSQIFNFTKAYDPINLFYPFLLVIVLLNNLLGLYIFGQHLFLSSFSFILISLTISLWAISYKGFFVKGMSHLTNMLVVNIAYPMLSLLLSNIEIITQIFRPVTLIARLWVNVWVGHCLLSIISFGWSLRISHTSDYLLPLILWPTLQSGLIIYEIGVALLQSLVVVYLSHLYYKENCKAVTSNREY